MLPVGTMGSCLVGVGGMNGVFEMVVGSIVVEVGVLSFGGSIVVVVVVIVVVVVVESVVVESTFVSLSSLLSFN